MLRFSEKIIGVRCWNIKLLKECLAPQDLSCNVGQTLIFSLNARYVTSSCFLITNKSNNDQNRCMNPRQISYHTRPSNRNISLNNLDGAVGHEK